MTRDKRWQAKFSGFVSRWKQFLSFKNCRSVRICSVLNRSNRDTTVYYRLIFCAFSWPNMVKWRNSGIIISLILLPCPQVLQTLRQLLPREPAVKQVTLDFEKAVWLAMRSVLPNDYVQLKGCAFHWTQALWRKVSHVWFRVVTMQRLLKRVSQRHCTQVSAKSFNV